VRHRRPLTLVDERNGTNEEAERNNTAEVVEIAIIVVEKNVDGMNDEADEMTTMMMMTSMKMLAMLTMERHTADEPQLRKETPTANQKRTQNSDTSPGALQPLPSLAHRP
jgi:hypothetical protein